MSVMGLILGMMAITFATRASFLVFGQRLQFPDIVRRALHYVPVAVLTALIVPMALTPKGQLWLSVANPYLVGTAVAALVAMLTRKTLLAIVLSFAVYLLWKLV